MQFSYEGSVVDDDLMSENSLVPAQGKAKKIVMGRSRGATPAGQSQAGWRRPVVAGGPGMTASPHRGPNRFLTLNMNAEAARGAAEVERQTRLLMEKMRAGSVPARPPPGSPLPKGYPGSPLRDRGGKENRNIGRVQSSSPAKRTPQRLPKPLGNLQHQPVGKDGAARGSPQQHRGPPLTPRCQPLNVPSPVVAAAGLARPLLDSSVGTDVMRGRGSEAARFITSTCARPQVARSRITPTHNLSVSLVKLKKSQLIAAGVQVLKKPQGNERPQREEEEEIPDLFPALERTDSDNFYPTPPIYRERKKTAASSKGKKKHAEVDMGDPEQVEAPSPASRTKQRLASARDSDADLGFGLPPPKPVPPVPSAPTSTMSGPISKSPTSKPPSNTPSLKPAQKPTSKPAIEKGSDNTGVGTFNFAKPTAPVSKPKKKAENVEQNYLDLWMPMLKNNKLYLEGNKLDPTTGAYFEERWHTSRIMTRISERIVATKKGTRYVLEGGLRVRDSELLGSSPIPEFIVNNFASGFPESWQTLVVSWSAWLERQKSTTNTSSRNAGILFNSTPMLATPSQGPPSNMTLGSVSSLTAIEASRFLPANKTNVGGVSCIACPNCQTVLLPPSETTARAEPMATIQEEREGTAENRRRSEEERELTTGNRGVRKSPRVLQKRGVEQPSQERSLAVATGEKTKGREGSRSQEKSDSNRGKASAGDTPEKQVEHRSRSKNVRTNRNSMTFMDTTMTRNDVTKLRAANYPCTVKDQGKKSYGCMFCDFKVRLFADLKEHISREHDRDAPGAAPTPKKPGRRSQSAETVREDEKRKTKGRRSISHTEGEEDMPACFKAVKMGSKTEYECSTCGGKVAFKSSIKGHCKSKKHLVAAASRGVKRKSEVSKVSQSPLRKVARQQEVSADEGKRVAKDALPGNGNQKKASRSQEKTSRDPSNQNKASRSQEKPSQEKARGDTPKRTPGLKRLSCFVCDFSTDEEAAFRSHLVMPQHGKKVRQSVEDSTDDTGYLHCDLCNVNEGEKKAFIKHLESGKHVKRAQQAAQSSKPHPSSEEVQIRRSEENEEEPVALKKQETVKGRPLNESRYGRKRKKNKAFARKSCVYTTPEFDEEDQEEEETPEEWKEKPKKKRKAEQAAVSNAKPDRKSKAKQKDKAQALPQRTKKLNVSDSSLRRVVLDPARAKASLPKPAPPPPKPTKSTEEILAKMSTNPKTVKQRQANMEAMEEYNENHEDDMFGGATITAVKSKGSLFKPSSKTLLADTDSDDDQDVTLCSAKTPVTAYLDNKERRERLLDHMKTPAELVMQTLSPMLPRPTKFQQAAFVQKKLVEKKKEARLEKRARLTSALASKSKAQMMAEVDQSSRMISQLTQGSRPSQSSIPEEDDAEEEWFDN